MAMTFARRGGFAQEERAGSDGVSCFRFRAGGANALQQKMGEFGEGGGFLAGDAALREQAKHMTEGAVHAGGGGEVARGGKQFGEIVALAADEAFREGLAEQLFFAFGMVDAERGMNV